MKWLSMLILFPLSNNCFADVIGTVNAKGMFVKDRIEVIGFDDPTIKGVTCYTTKYIRPFEFNDSTNSSLSCRKTGKISGNLSEMKNVFSQDKSALFFKETVVDRFYDKKRNVLVYLSYTKSWGENNASHSLSVVPIDE